jgi:hypothetical protein
MRARRLGKFGPQGRLTVAHAWCDDRDGEISGRDPADGLSWEWLEHGERERGLKHSTLRDYRYLLRTHLPPAFGTRPRRVNVASGLQPAQSRLV